MAMTDPLILPADVTVVPVAQLPADLRDVEAQLTT